MSGDEILVLLRASRVTQLEDHISSIYEMRSEELSAELGALIATVFAILLATMVAFVQMGSPETLTTTALPSTILLTLSASLWWGATKVRLAWIRTDSQWAKHYASVLSDVYR